MSFKKIKQKIKWKNEQILYKAVFYFYYFPIEKKFLKSKGYRKIKPYKIKFQRKFVRADLLIGFKKNAGKVLIKYGINNFENQNEINICDKLRKMECEELHLDNEHFLFTLKKKTHSILAFAFLEGYVDLYQYSKISNTLCGPNDSIISSINDLLYFSKKLILSMEIFTLTIL